MSTICPDCTSAIAADQINVPKDVAFCQTCNKAFALSALVHGTSVARQVELAHPPPGAWYRDDGVEVTMGATARTLGTGLFFLFFTTIWNSFTWVVVGKSIGHMLGPTTAPAPSSTPNPAEPGLLFMVPFVLIGVFTAVGTMFFFFGKVEICIRGDVGRAFVGVGLLGWRSRFNPSQVTNVSIEPASWQQNGRVVYQVVLKGPDARFGSGLTEERRAFLAAALRRQFKA